MYDLMMVGAFFIGFAVVLFAIEEIIECYQTARESRVMRERCDPSIMTDAGDVIELPPVPDDLDPIAQGSRDNTYSLTYRQRLALRLGARQYQRPPKYW